MRFETFIAQRLYFSQQGETRSSRPAVRVALAGIIIGVMVMFITVCIVVGFKQTVTDKVVGFSAHIQVVNFDNNNTYEMQPITVSDSMLTAIAHLPYVKNASTFITKPGIIKTKDAFHGIVMKGTDDLDYFSQNLKEGSLPSCEKEAIISYRLSQLLQLKVGDTFFSYFVGEKVQVRKLTISGIYETGFVEFDELFVLSQPQLLRRLNGWSEKQVSGIGVQVDDMHHIMEASDAVFYATANRFDEDGNGYYMETVEQLNPQIFSWLDLLDANVVVIILLMLCVSGFNIISGLIILILDSITLIGTLKALGANNKQVRRIFITQAAMLVGKGVVWGNLLGIVLCIVQYYGHVIGLDAATYYVSYVPIAFPIGWLVLLNIGVIAISLLILLAPSSIVTRISPAKVMHFE